MGANETSRPLTFHKNGYILASNDSFMMQLSSNPGVILLFYVIGSCMSFDMDFFCMVAL